MAPASDSAGRLPSGLGFLSPEKVDGILALIGGFCLHLTLGTLYCFGNLNTYMTSYLRKHVHPGIEYSDMIWVPCLATVSQVSLLFQSTINSTCIWLADGVVFNRRTLLKAISSLALAQTKFKINNILQSAIGHLIVIAGAANSKQGLKVLFNIDKKGPKLRLKNNLLKRIKAFISLPLHK